MTRYERMRSGQPHVRLIIAPDYDRWLAARRRAELLRRVVQGVALALTGLLVVVVALLFLAQAPVVDARNVCTRPSGGGAIGSCPPIRSSSPAPSGFVVQLMTPPATDTEE